MPTKMLRVLISKLNRVVRTVIYAHMSSFAVSFIHPVLTASLVNSLTFSYYRDRSRKRAFDVCRWENDARYLETSHTQVTLQGWWLATRSATTDGHIASAKDREWRRWTRRKF